MSPLASQSVVNKRAVEQKTIHLDGSFGMGVTNVFASYTLAIAAGADIVVTADVEGVAGNALDFQATADGLAKAAIDFGAVLTQLDTVMEFTTGGVGGNAWSVIVMAGSGGAEGVNVYEDTTNKILTIMYEDGVSTVTNVETAIGTTANFAVRTGGTGANVLAAGQDDLPQTLLTGGTPQEWAEETGTPLDKMHLHFEATVTTGAEGVIAINAVVAKSMTATGGDANAMAGGDAVAKQDLAGGVDAVTLSGERGPGGYDGDGTGKFTVAKTGVGEYTITFADWFPDLLYFKPTLQLDTATDQYCMGGAYDAAAKTIIVYIWDKSVPGVADPAVHANNRINFAAIFTNYGG